MNFKKICINTVAPLLIALIFGIVFFEGCGSKSTSTYQLTGDVAVDGKNLTQTYCTKCHALVPLNALSKAVWINHTLPAMAPRLHISTYGGTQYFIDKPTDTGLTLQNWQAIVSYYEKLAPDSLPIAKKPFPLVSDLDGFTLKIPPPIKDAAFTTMAAIDPATRNVITSDYVSGKLTEWDNDFKAVKTVDLPSAAVNALFRKGENGENEVILSCVGKLEPIDFPNGKVVKVISGNKNNSTKPSLIADIIERPVQTIEGDFNKDGLNDFLILGQGHLKGGVYLYSQNKDKTYTQTTISQQPGAVQAVAGDFNHDGWLDFMVLFGSGDEGLWLFENDKKGGFTSRNLLRFPPVYGSTSFQLADMDHDGNPDLIYTCGYNFHDSRILKPYHGLYIYKNLGNWNFKQSFFYPIDGCTKAITADFDGDGDFDIVTSAFFADMKNNPEESCIYFEQVEPLVFKAHAFPISKYGHWMTMDVGDFNYDGKPDIILGNYSTGFMFQPGFKPFWNRKLPFVVLQNNFVSFSALKK